MFGFKLNIHRHRKIRLGRRARMLTICIRYIVIRARRTLIHRIKSRGGLMCLGHRAQTKFNLAPRPTSAVPHFP